MHTDLEILTTRDAKEKRAAYSDFLEHGMEWVKKYYPNQVAFIEANKDKPETEVLNRIRLQDHRIDVVDQYLVRTGQTLQEVLSGASQTGMGYVLEDLIPQALKENKKIVWTDGPRFIGGEYSLIPIDQ